jgi:hypothetical protein
MRVSIAKVDAHPTRLNTPRDDIPQGRISTKLEPRLEIIAILDHRESRHHASRSVEMI